LPNALRRLATSSEAPARAGGLLQLPLEPHFNNTAITSAAGTGDGRFNVWGNSLPAEHLPAGAEVTVAGVSFRFPPAGGGRPDNLRCEGQLVPVAAGRYDWLYLLAASERRTEDAVALHYADGSVDLESLRVSDFWAAPAWFGEVEAFRCPVMHYPHHVQTGVPALLWCQRVPVTRLAELAGVRFPRNLAVHVFAATLVSTPRWAVPR
jgi:hypothetical protein